MTFFNQCDQLLNGAERLQINVSRADDHRLSVTLVPILKSLGDEASVEDDESLASLRAALAMPIQITETAQALDAGLFETLRTWARTRSDLSAAQRTLHECRESAKQASAKSAASTSKPGSRAKESAKAQPTTGTATAPATAEVPPPVAQTTSNPDNLFA